MIYRPRTWSRLTLAASLTLAACSALGGTVADGLTCTDANECSISYNHLSNQRIDPLLFLGREVDKEHPQWKNYGRSLRKHPDVRDCLLRSERDKENPNLLAFDWSGIETFRAWDVCLFRVFSSLGEEERIRSWLQAQGFRVTPSYPFGSGSESPDFDRDVAWGFDAGWTTEQYREVHPSFLANLTGVDLVQAVSLSVRFSGSGKLVFVNVLATAE